MTTEQSCHLMKPHKSPPISCLTCRSLGGASQRSAMAILRCGISKGVVIVMMTASQGHPHTVSPSHTCPPHSLELSLEFLGEDWLLRVQQEGDWLLRIQQEEDWLLKAQEASPPLCPFSSSLLLLICQKSPVLFRF